MGPAAQLVAAEYAPAVEGVGAGTGKVCNFPGDTGVGFGYDFCRADVDAVALVGVVEAAVAAFFAWGPLIPCLGEGDAFFGALILQAEVLEEARDVVDVGGSEVGWGGVVAHEVVKYGEGDSATGFVEEGYGD